jgi:hypothetical protein
MPKPAIAMAFLCAAPVFGGAEAFNGRWNITVANDSRGRAWWLEVDGAGTPAIRGKFVGAPGGQVDKIPEIRVQGGELIWVFNKAYRRDPNLAEQTPRKGVYRAKIAGDKLTGRLDVDGLPQLAAEFTGKRAPELKDKDDGKWRAGKPVELFNGKALTGWVSRFPGKPIDWKVENGVMTNGGKAVDIGSTAKFFNFKMRIEYRVAAKSNSGIGLRGRYELQIFGDHGMPPSDHGNGAVYNRIAPKVNATLPPDQWQTLEVTFVGRELTAVMNGKMIHDHVVIEGLTAMASDPNEDQPGPLTLQGDHGLVEFRKITVTPLMR